MCLISWPLRSRVVILVLMMMLTYSSVTPGPTGENMYFLKLKKKLFLFFSEYKRYAMAENRTRINCLEGNYADHYTTNALLSHIYCYCYGLYFECLSSVKLRLVVTLKFPITSFYKRLYHNVYNCFV